MSNADSSAFPEETYGNAGLTKREYFAGLVLHAMLANSDWCAAAREIAEEDDASTQVLLANMALKQTDIFLAELEKA